MEDEEDDGMSCHETTISGDEASNDGLVARKALFGVTEDHSWDRGTATNLLSDGNSVCSRIFRFALSRVMGLAPRHYSVEHLVEVMGGDYGIHPAIVSLLLHVIEAEKVILPEAGKQPGGDGGNGTTPNAKKGKKRVRRVSFNTFDLSTVDTPDLQRKGSNRQMEHFLTTLHQVLFSAEAVRGIIAQSPAAVAGG